MKKIVMLFVSVFFATLSAQLLSHEYEEQDSCFTTAFTAGYVFKNDCLFKQIYGHGMANIITADGCYSFAECWGVGAKISYWHAHGRTTFLKQCTFLQEVPFTLYLRRIKDFRCGLQTYASLGGGVAWIQEKSYLGKSRAHKAIGELEVGLQYPVWRCLNITTAFRYLFPPQSPCGAKIDVGGCDLRAGIGFSF